MFMVVDDGFVCMEVIDCVEVLGIRAVVGWALVFVGIPRAEPVNIEYYNCIN